MQRHFVVDLSERHIEGQWSDVTSIPKIMEMAGNLAMKIYDGIVEESNMPRMINLIWRSGFCNILNIPKQYKREMELIGGYTNTEREIFFSNISYELAKMPECKNLIESIFWCTSVSMPTSSGMLHARNLDWPVDGLKNNVITIDFDGAPAGPFTSITFPGCVGVLTGIARDRFSASVNMLIGDYPISIRGMPIAFIVREMFEKCRSYKSALKFLSNATAFAPAIVHLVGVNGESSAVAVMSTGDNYIFNDDSDILGVTNHMPSDEFDDDEYEVDSQKRLDVIQRRAKAVKTPSQAFEIMRRGPIYSKDITTYTVVMNPKTGEYWM